MQYQVKLEKLIHKPVSEVFRAIGEGRLFVNCSADSNSIKVDFRVGGKYHVEFKNHKVENFGEFLEIVPDKKIVFNWCQNFGADQKPDSIVTIELFPDGSKTKVVLLHTGFKDQENCDAHMQGWIGGFTDLGEELTHGRLRLVRQYATSAANLYEICKNPATFFGYMGDLAKGSVEFKEGGKIHVPNSKGGPKGEFLEIIPQQKIVFSWLNGCEGGPLDGKVTLYFHAKPDGTSSLEIVHDGLPTEKEQKAHHGGWDFVTCELTKVVDKG